MTFDKALDVVMKLDYASREILYALLQKRLVEDKRKQIARNASKAKKDFSRGILKSKFASEIINELDNN